MHNVYTKKKSFRVFPALFFTSVISFLPSFANGQSANALVSGKWDSDIWGIRSEIEAGLRPSGNDQILIQENVVVTANSRLPESGSFVRVQLGGDNSGLILESGAVFSTEILNIAAGDCSVTVKEGANLAIGDHGLRVSNGARGSMRVEGGVVSVGGEDFMVAGGKSSTGLLEISGGIMSYSGASLSLASNKDTVGTLQVNGGIFSAQQILFTQNQPSALGKMDLQSGTLKAKAFNSGIAPANAMFEWTGGTLVLGESNMDITNTGTGDFAIGGVGAVGTFVVSDDASISYTQGKNASLTLDFASDKKFDTFTLGKRSSFRVTLNGKMNLNFLKGYTPAPGRAFDVITADAIVNEGLVLGGNGASRFAFKIVKAEGKDVLRLTSVPANSGNGSL